MFVELNRQRYSLNNLHLVTPNSEFEEETIQFIQQWIRGIEKFQLATSGSTGLPKPITISRDKMELSAKATLKALRLAKKGTALVCLNTKFIAGKMLVVRALINKMNIIAVEPTANPLAFIDSKQELNFTAMVPLQMEAIVDSGQYKYQLDHFDAILLGGAPIGSTLQKHLKNFKSPMYATYGMTETVSHIALKHLNGQKKEAYFEALDGVELGVDDRGCLTICSTLTDHTTITTNDLVELIGDSKFEWLGRFDNIINTGGVKVQSEALESVISHVFEDLQTKNRFFCYGIPDEKLGQRIVLIVEGELKNPDLILKNIKDRVDLYHEPKSIYTIPEFVETRTKKIQRKLTVDKIISSPPSA